MISDRPSSILPITKSTNPVPVVDSFLTLPGQGVARDNCGEVRAYRTCPDHPSEASKVSCCCFKPSCPVCYEKWAGREADKISDRLLQSQILYARAGNHLGELRHIIISPPVDSDFEKHLLNTEAFKAWRTRCNKVFRDIGVYGGVIIFHPYRGSHSRGWSFSPHFHVVGWGFLQESKDVFNLTGWVYKNMGRRDSLEGTFQYLLTHCGIPKDTAFDRVHSATYFGAVSYNKIVVVSLEVVRESTPCPVCRDPIHTFGMNENGDIDLDKDMGIYYSKTTKRIYKLSDRKKKKRYIKMSQLDLMSGLFVLYNQTNRDTSLTVEGFISMCVSKFNGEKFERLRSCVDVLERRDGLLFRKN